MRILIIEDEQPASTRLKKLLLEAEPEAIILDEIVSVKSAVDWFKNHSQPDLVFMDIHLSDGNSFDIFELVNITAPVIFITAYDEFALKAFKVNSVEYLLKPVKQEELVGALNKFKTYFNKNTQLPDLSKIMENLKDPGSTYKKRFLIRYGEHIKAVETENVAYFYTEEKINFLRTKDNHSYHIEYNLDKLEGILDPAKFFRINRQFIINYEAIDQMFSFSKSRVKINLKPPINLDTIVSTERSPLFKEWLSGKE